MGYFADSQEVYRYIGQAFRLAQEDAQAGPKLRAANVKVRLDFTDPQATLNVRFAEPEIQVIEGGNDAEQPDILLRMSADNADKFWRGEYNAALGLAKGEVKARGPVSKVLRLLPLAKPVFPLYRTLVAEKDARKSAQ
ncbi:SCP2 sterol-binding domain-containing protein [Mycobacteroides immunogenum]|uniref:SCP2 sterol-binding domain-containing protein n=1 Tax=Mycobacteroides immunogenum TaxID=83262 RepID=UPI0025B7703F|nr:SCP2 sterol-binding domain-containing protein [Mycobacteroides immunogenum]WJR32689.1 SCP2 sterol-binding domain-containing protein [Mycobacteroides immunogenum]